MRAFGLQLVGGGVVRKPERRLSISNHLLLLLLEHDDLLLALLGGGATSDSGPGVRVECLVLQNLRLTLCARLGNQLLQRAGYTWLLLVSFVGRADTTLRSSVFWALPRGINIR